MQVPSRRALLPGALGLPHFFLLLRLVSKAKPSSMMSVIGPSSAEASMQVPSQCVLLTGALGMPDLFPGSPFRALSGM